VPPWVYKYDDGTYVGYSRYTNPDSIDRARVYSNAGSAATAGKSKYRPSKPGRPTRVTVTET
jgi:hypothetical protein